MKITIEDHDRRSGANYDDKFIQYEDHKIDEDFDFIFNSLRLYQDYLKSEYEQCDCLGKRIFLQGQIDKIDSLFEKYSKFIETINYWRNNKL